jgi:hypothetical protein
MFFPSSQRLYRLWANLASYSVGKNGFFSGFYWPVREIVCKRYQLKLLVMLGTMPEVSAFRTLHCSTSCKWLIVLPCAVTNECRLNSYVYHLVYQIFNVFTIYKENEKETFKVGLMTCFVSRNFLQR